MSYPRTASPRSKITPHRRKMMHHEQVLPVR
jgi:hypothetical protein